MEQRTPEWLAARLGKITGTKAHNLLSSATTRKTLLVQLFREISLASAKQIPETAAMAEGTRLEPEAIDAYVALKHSVVHGDNSYVIHPDEPRFCFSPDGLVGEDGMIEIKCRNPEEHIYRMIYGIKKDESHQCEMGLFVTGREWIDYVGYCPELPEKIRIFTKRITMKPARREEINELGTGLLENLDAVCKEYNLDF